MPAEEEKKEEKSVSTETIAAGGTITAGVGSLAIAANPLGFVAAACSGYSGMLVIKQKHSITKSGDVLDKNEQLNEQIGELERENKQLMKSVKKLKAAANRMKAIEDGLSAMAEQQGTDLNRLKALTEENQKTIDETRKLMKGKICQHILSTVLKCDDGDFMLDEKETDILCLRLNQIEGVVFHEEEMRNLIEAQNGSLYAVMGVVRALMEKNPDPGTPVVFSFPFDDNDDDI